MSVHNLRPCYVCAARLEIACDVPYVLSSKPSVEYLHWNFYIMSVHVTNVTSRLQLMKLHLVVWCSFQKIEKYSGSLLNIQWRIALQLELIKMSVHVTYVTTELQLWRWRLWCWVAFSLIRGKQGAKTFLAMSVLKILWSFQGKCSTFDYEKMSVNVTNVTLCSLLSSWWCSMLFFFKRLYLLKFYTRVEHILSNSVMLFVGDCCMYYHFHKKIICRKTLMVHTAQTRISNYFPWK